MGTHSSSTNVWGWVAARRCLKGSTIIFNDPCASAHLGFKVNCQGLPIYPRHCFPTYLQQLWWKALQNEWSLHTREIWGHARLVVKTNSSYDESNECRFTYLAMCTCRSWGNTTSPATHSSSFTPPLPFCYNCISNCYYTILSTFPLSVSYISFGLNIMLSNKNYHDNGSSFVEYWPQSFYLAGGWISFCNQDISIEGVMLYSMDQFHTSNQSACYCDVHIWFFTLMNSSNISSAAGPTLSFW